MNLFELFFPKRTKPIQRQRNPLQAKLHLELLEDRVVPTITLAPNIFTDPALSTISPPLAAPGTISLRSAIQTINGSTADTTAVINLAAGVYIMQQPQTKPPNVDDNTNGDFTIHPQTVTNITINGGVGGGVTVIDAQGLDRVFHIIPSANDLTVTFNNVVIQNGLAGGSSAFGGAIFFDDAGTSPNNDQLFVNNCILTNNAADNDGGAIFTYNAQITMTNDDVVLNTTAHSGGGVATYLGIVNNTGSFYAQNLANGDGGALYLGGDVLKTGVTPNWNLVIDRTGFLANVAGGSGGAYFDQNVGSLTVRNGSFFDDNSSSGLGGGALYFLDHAATFTGASIDGNSTGGGGGGILDAATTGGAAAAPTGTLTVTSCDLSNDVADGGGIPPAGGGGGAISNGTGATNAGGNFIDGAITVAISACTFNTDTYDGDANGGGAIVDFGSTAFSVDGSSFTNDLSETDGGALSLLSTNAAYTIGKTTGDIFNFNRAFGADPGGAISDFNASQSFDLENSVITNNIAGGGGGVQTNAISVTLTGNVFSGNIATNTPLAGGSSGGGGFYDGGGGGLGGVAPNATTFLLATNNFFSYNNTKGSGGGMFIAATHAQISGIQSLYNTAEVNGGGIEFEGVNLVIVSGPGGATPLIQGNFAAANGGGIDAGLSTDTAVAPNTIILKGIDIVGNRAALTGGGVNVAPLPGQTDPFTTLTMQNDLVQLNVAGDPGGGVASNAALNTFQSDVITLNHTTEGGGGIDLIANPGDTGAAGIPYQEALVLQSYIANNYAGGGGDGGGILASLTSNGYMEVVDDTIYGNTAGQNGGGVAVEGGTQADLLFDTINANMAGAGGGVYNSAIGPQSTDPGNGGAGGGPGAGGSVPVGGIAVGLGNTVIAGNFAAPDMPLQGNPPQFPTPNTGANGYAVYGLFSDYLYTPGVVVPATHASFQGTEGPSTAVQPTLGGATPLVGHNYIDALGPSTSYKAAYPGDLTGGHNDNVQIWIDFNEDPPPNYLGMPAYNGGPTQPPGFFTEKPLNPTLNNSGANPVLDDGIINVVVQAFFSGGNVVDQIGQPRPLNPTAQFPAAPDLGAFEVS